MVITRSSLNKIQNTLSTSSVSIPEASKNYPVSKSASDNRIRTRNTRFENVDDDISCKTSQNHSISNYFKNNGSSKSGRSSLFTSSARKAALCSHKIYTPETRRRSSRLRVPIDVLTYDHYKNEYPENHDDDEVVIEQFEGGDYDDDEEEKYDVCDTAEILASLASSNPDEHQNNLNSPMDRCLNPVSSEMCYVYNLIISDPTGQQLYSSSYILYNMRNRTYYIFNKITLITHSHTTHNQEQEIGAPTPYYLQTKYSSYMRDSIDKYIQNLLVFRQIPQSIETRFIGLVTSEQTINNIFNSDGCYYDIDSLFNSKSSSETLNGNELFVLTPIIYYSNITFADNIQDILTILSGQH